MQDKGLEGLETLFSRSRGQYKTGDSVARSSNLGAR